MDASAPDALFNFTSIGIIMLLKADEPAMDELLTLLPGVTPFNHDGIEPVFEGLLAKHNLKMVALAQACGVSISGTTVSPPIFQVMEILGKEETLARVRKGRALIAAP
ncbi:MAG: hypothetical protein HY286_18115 [Planctomycetes bacterium]|nr:hypothetical protein [Planctomycetota bacterium]